jgi:CHAD domain-containing protein
MTARACGAKLQDHLSDMHETRLMADMLAAVADQHRDEFAGTEAGRALELHAAMLRRIKGELAAVHDALFALAEAAVYGPAGVVATDRVEAA